MELPTVSAEPQALPATADKLQVNQPYKTAKGVAKLRELLAGRHDPEPEPTSILPSTL